jgi:alpha-D-ribose 1-methylphosphonate 5-triphosphate synthase subunit PhnH
MITLEKPWNPLEQRLAFRALMDAWARPGTIAELTSWSAAGAAGLCVLATLCDQGTSLCDLHGQLAPGDRSRLGVPLRDPANAAEAAFILADGTRDPETMTPQRGTLLAPELGATVVLTGADFSADGTELVLQGPGIATTCRISVGGLHPGWLEARSRWCDFPLGVDLVLCSGSSILCLPRHVRIGA